MRASDSEPLAGGNTHAEIVRVRDTVRRPAGAWTPAVHALLDHLSAAGFAAAPRALGLDEDGREVVSYAPGDVVWPGHFELLEHDEALIEVAQLIRRYHDVVANFVPPPGALWWDLAADPSGVHELVCHNDLAPGTSFAVPTEAGRSSTGTSPHRAGACGISVGRSSRSFR